MKVIVGLGNPGKQFDKTRHNVGFEVIDILSEELDIPLDKQKFKGVYGMGTYQDEKVILLKPLTFMNLSGESVKPLIDFYNLSIEDFIVIYDDMDLPPGKIRLRMKGSAGGHNGIKSIIQHFGIQTFKRIRIGIGRPPNEMTVTNYVLGRFLEEEQDDVATAVKQSAEACKAWCKAPFIEVMNEFNR